MTEPAPEAIAALIARLGDTDFQRREAASAELKAIGPAAVDALLAAAELDRDLAAGRFDGLLTWLRQHVHAYGRQFESAALVEQASGEPVSERWLVESLWQRYGAAHGIA
jgi:hypothetical protein